MLSAPQYLQEFVKDMSDNTDVF